MQELEDARTITAISGIDSPQAAVAWDIVEELLSNKADSRKKYWDKYCKENPNSSECCEYDV